MKRCQGLRQATPHGVCSHFQVLHQRQSQHLCHLDALPIGLQAASPVSLLHNLFDWQGAPCLRDDICKQWRCSVLLCMPILALAADALLHTATAVLFLWQQALVPASRATLLGWLVALHHHQDSGMVKACQYVLAPSRRLQPLCQQQDKRSNVGQGKGILNFIRSASCSRYAQSGFKLQYTAC